MKIFMATLPSDRSLKSTGNSSADRLVLCPICKKIHESGTYYGNSYGIARSEVLFAAGEIDE